MSLDYTSKVLEYFRNPRNMGKIENADGVGRVGNPICEIGRASCRERV